MAVASLVLGVLALVLMWIPVLGIAAIPAALIGIVLAVVGKKNLAAAGSPTGMATAGLVCSIIALIISTIFTLVCGACAAVCATPALFF
ncbi:MAG: hypothetical protein FWE34_06675 [Defluviitaleaceae bacterium]|nr:hypothetical protein [Defluviitaleaceae bacterium]